MEKIYIYSNYGLCFKTDKVLSDKSDMSTGSMVAFDRRGRLCCLKLKQQNIYDIICPCYNENVAKV